MYDINIFGFNLLNICLLKFICRIRIRTNVTVETRTRNRKTDKYGTKCSWCVSTALYYKYYI